MNKAGYLGYIHSFRGFALLNVVAVHALSLAIIIPSNWVSDPTAPLTVLSETLFHDSTIYFALISGLLFSAILRLRGYQDFYPSKAMYVLLPYIAVLAVRLARLSGLRLPAMERVRKQSGVFRLCRSVASTRDFEAVATRAGPFGSPSRVRS